MRIASSIKFSIAPVLLVLAYACAFIAASNSRSAFVAVHFPLELVIIASLIGCIVAVVSLFPQRKSPSCRVPFLLNAAVVAAMLLWIVIGISVIIVRGI